MLLSYRKLFSISRKYTEINKIQRNSSLAIYSKREREDICPVEW